MSCVKNCEREVPEVNARPPGLDYGLPWLLPPALQKPENMSLSQVETNFWLGALVTTLQGSVFVHYMPKILSEVGINPAIASATPALDMPFLAHSVITGGLLALPGLVSLAADKVSLPLESTITSLKSQWEKRTESLERQAILDIYETVMKSDKPLKETLKDFDPDGDGMITCWECKRAMGYLNLPEKECEILMGLMKRRFGSDTTALSIESWLDYLQELYVSASEAELGSSDKQRMSRLQRLGNELPSKKTFVEIFNDLDKDGDGFVSEEDFSALLEKSKLKTPLTEQEKHELFGEVDRLKDGHLNLFEFMSVMRKIVRVGIQEIGYGYLPLAWASLTAYWLSVGMKELGLTLARLPDTLYLDHSIVNLPQIAASTETVQVVQAVLVAGALPLSIGLTQKLCNDNKIRGLRLGLHVAIQVTIAAATLHLMLGAPSVA